MAVVVISNWWHN